MSSAVSIHPFTRRQTPEHVAHSQAAAALPKPQRIARPNAPRTTRPVVVFGCSGENPRQDGLAVQVADALAGVAPPQTEVRTLAPPEMDVLLNLADVRLLILVDTVKPSAQFPAGSWTRISYGGFGTGRRRGRPPRVPRPVPLQPRGCAAINPKTLRINQVLELGRRLGVLPINVWVYVVADSGTPGEDRSSTGAWNQGECELDTVVASIRHDVIAWLTHGTN